MYGGTVRRGRTWAGLALVAALGAGCASGSVEPVTTDAWVDGGLPEYCGGVDGRDAEFWDVVHTSCDIAQDGDMQQAVALRDLLAELSSEDVADFRRTFKRLNKGLGPVMPVADDICAPGLGLGDDLGTDYRSWLIAHGKAAYDALLADPERLRDFPDAEAGCGLGEPFGQAASGQLVDDAGLEAADVEVPVVER
jgi:hypothetical protein